MAKVETTGTYLWEVLESGVNLTQTGKPQWVARLKATKKYIEDSAEIKHFQGQGLLADGQPAYVDWSSFDEEIVAFMLLFNSADEFSEETAMKNYEQLQTATGWDGQDFDSLPALAGKIILGRVQEKKPYTNSNGKVVEGGLEVAWIDAPDASPERQLKTVSVDEIKNLNAKLKIKKAKPAAAAAPAPITKPTSAPTVAVAPATAAPNAASSAPTTTTPAATATKTKAPKAPKKQAEAPAAPPAPAASPVPAKEVTMEDAWAAVCAAKGDNEDQVVEEAWIAATGEIAGDKDQEQVTPAEWAKIRDIVLKDLAA